MKNSVLFLCFLMGFSYSNSAQPMQPIVSAYYETNSQVKQPSGNRVPFSPNIIDPNILTDLYVAFAGFGYITQSVNPKMSGLTGDFIIQPLLAADIERVYPQIQALKERSKKSLRTFLSIGGWGFNDPNDQDGIGQHTYQLFSKMVSTKANRKQFIDSAIAFAHKYGFDGIDIDWEYPGHLQRGGHEDDFDNFIEFLSECSQAFRATSPPLLLSYAAAPFVPYGVPQKYRDNPDLYFKWIAACSQYLDRINIMTYDYHGPFDVPKITGANSPLNRDTDPSSTYYIARTVQYYLSNGVPADKMVLGLPTFGHSYKGVSKMTASDNGPGKLFEGSGLPGPTTKNPGFLAYFEVSDMIAGKKLTFGTDPITGTAYGFNLSSEEWVSFDTPETNKLKAEIAKDKQLAGIMVWAINLDEYQWEPTFPTIRAAWTLLRGE